MTDNMIPTLTPMGPSTSYYVVTEETPIFMSRDYGSAVAVYQSRSHGMAAAFGAVTSAITLSHYDVDSVGWMTVYILARK